jgi:hypothetical protein
MRGDEMNLDVVRDQIKNLKVGITKVMDVSITLEANAFGEDALFFTLVLNKPKKDTWPIDDIWELRKIVNDIVNANIEGPWYLRFNPVR